MTVINYFFLAVAARPEKSKRQAGPGEHDRDVPDHFARIVVFPRNVCRETEKRDFHDGEHHENDYDHSEHGVGQVDRRAV